MEILIDPDAQTPVFAQLIEQIKVAVQKGRLAPGAALPSIRQLANDLDLNNKTVAKAYQRLERDEVIQTKGYRGTFIHPEAPQNCDTNLSALAHERLSDAVQRCRDAGATDSEIRIAFTEVMQMRETKGS